MEITVIQVLSIGVILLISEMMVGTLDLLAIGVAAIITSAIMRITGITDLMSVVLIFAVLAVISVFVMRFFIKEKFIKTQGKEVASKESMVGLILPVNMTNNVKTVYNEGIYVRISNADDVKVGDMVKILSTSTTSVIVEKVSDVKKAKKEEAEETSKE